MLALTHRWDKELDAPEFGLHGTHHSERAREANASEQSVYHLVHGWKSAEALFACLGHEERLLSLFLGTPAEIEKGERASRRCTTAASPHERSTIVNRVCSIIEQSSSPTPRAAVKSDAARDVAESQRSRK